MGLEDALEDLTGKWEADGCILEGKRWKTQNSKFKEHLMKGLFPQVGRVMGTRKGSEALGTDATSRPEGTRGGNGMASTQCGCGKGDSPSSYGQG